MKKMMKMREFAARGLGIYKFLPAAVVLIMVFVPFIGNMFVSNTVLLDNRPFNEKPARFSKDFFSKYEGYYNDTFAWRKSMVKKYTRIREKLKIDTGRFFHGSGDWMYYDSSKASDGNSIIDYRGEIRFSDKELQQMIEGLEKAKEYYAKRGIKYFVVVTPNKEGIYPENMPENLQKVRKSEKSRADTAAAYINSNSTVKVINVKDEILKARKKLPYNLYFKRDTHWNDLGAYVGYAAIAKELRRQGVDMYYQDPAKVKIKEFAKKGGDMDRSFMDVNYEVSYLPHDNFNQELSLNNERFMIYKAERGHSKKTLLMFRDSFTANLIPYFSKNFKTTLYLRSSKKAHEEIDDYLREYKPDVVIDQVVERNFDKFLKYKEYYDGKE